MRTLLRPPVLALSAIMVVALLLAQTAPVIERDAGIALVLCLFSIGLWATGLLAEYLVALIFFTLVMLTRLVPADIAFAGFASSAIWLIFAGIFIGMAVNQTGLGDRLARHMAKRLGRHYWQHVLGLVLFGIFMSFIMPSAMGRVVMMLPLLVALATRLGFAKGSKAYTGLLLAGVLGTYLPAFAVLPANVPNMVLAGTLEALQDKAPVFGGYLLLHFPVLGAAKSVVLVVLLTLLFRDKSHAPETSTGDEPLAPMSSGERRLTVLLVAALAMWLTDFLHNISPAWIAMVVAVLLLLPKNGMLPPKSFPKANLAPVIYVAGIISLGAVVNATGIGALAADMLLSFLPLETANNFGIFGILSAISALVGLVTTLPGVPAVLSPLSESFAAKSGLSLNAVVMTQVVGFSTVILPYQSPPLVVAMQTASISFKDMTRVCLAMAALSVLLLWPLDYLWWQILGLI